MTPHSCHLGRRFASATIALTMLALAGCGSPPDANVGHLEGSVSTEGGPSDATHPVEATVVATLLGGDAKKSYSTQTDGTAAFTFDLPPGQYELTGTLTSLNPGDQLTPEDVDVMKGRTTTVELFAFYP